MGQVRSMNKKLLRLTFILACLLTVAYIIQPNLAKVSAGHLVVFNRLGPSGDIHQGDIIIFGGTIYNNESIATYILTYLEVEVLALNDSGVLENIRPFEDFSFDSLPNRNTVAPYESRTFAFQHIIGDEWPVEDNYTVTLKLHYRDIKDVGDEQVVDYELQIGESKTVNVKVKRIDAPNYIYGVFVVLLLAILAFIIIGLVGWIRERRAKQ